MEDLYKLYIKRSKLNGTLGAAKKIIVNPITPDNLKEILSKYQTKQIKAGNNLIISLNRTLPDNQKNEIKVVIPDKFYNYKLKGFIVHLGGSGVVGHYVYYGLYDGKWIKFDDEKVEEATGKIEEIKQTGYIYYFERDKNQTDKLLESEVDNVTKDDAANLKGSVALEGENVVFVDKQPDKSLFKGFENSNINKLTAFVQNDVLTSKIIPYLEKLGKNGGSKTIKHHKKKHRKNRNKTVKKRPQRDHKIKRIKKT